MKMDEGELTCARCRLKVSIMGYDGGGVRYMHAGGLDLEAAGKGRIDHDPEPAVMPSGSAILMCDFCDVKHPQWVVPLMEKADMTVSTPAFDLEARDDGWWAACDTCVELVSGRKIRLLRQRSLETLAGVMGREPHPEVANYIRMAHARFWACQPGPALPLIR